MKTIATQALAILLATAGGNVHAIEKLGPCENSAQAIARALSVAAYGDKSFAGKISVNHEAETEVDVYSVIVESKPFAWGNGSVRPYVLKYSVTFDNDSDMRCALIDATLNNK